MPDIHYPWRQRLAAFLVAPAVAWCWLVYLVTGHAVDVTVRQRKNI